MLAAQWQTGELEDGGAVARISDGAYVLSVGCVSGTTTVWMEVPTPVLPEHKGAFRFATLVVDFDEVGSTYLRWPLSEDGRWLSAPHNQTFSFIRDLIISERVTIQMASARYDALTAHFDLTGFKAALQPVAKACGWKGY